MQRERESERVIEVLLFHFIFLPPSSSSLDLASLSVHSFPTSCFNPDNLPVTCIRRG